MSVVATELSKATEGRLRNPTGMLMALRKLGDIERLVKLQFDDDDPRGKALIKQGQKMVMKEWHMVTGVPNESGEGEGEPSGSAAPNEGKASNALDEEVIAHKPSDASPKAVTTSDPSPQVVIHQGHERKPVEHSKKSEDDIEDKMSGLEITPKALAL